MNRHRSGTGPEQSGTSAREYRSHGPDIKGPMDGTGRSPTRRTRSQAGRLARRKGQRFERDVARMLAPHWPGAARCVDQTRTARVAGCDVEGTPLWIEAKHRAALDLAAALAQAERDTDGRPCVVIAKRNRRELVAHCRLGVLLAERRNHGPPVTLALADFLALVTVEMSHAP